MKECDAYVFIIEYASYLAMTSIICTRLHSVTSQKQTTCVTVFTKACHWSQMNPDHTFTFTPYLPRFNYDTGLISWYLEYSKSLLSSRTSTCNISSTCALVALPNLSSCNALHLKLINKQTAPSVENHKQLLNVCCNL